MDEARGEYGKLRFEELNYGSYLRIPELLALQQLRSKPPHHDEMFFIVIHQSFELWFKEVLHELDLLGEHLAAGSVSRALKTVKRVNAILDCLVQQIQLLATLTPVEFAGFRSALGAGSGFQSLQFREIEFTCGLRDDFFVEFFGRWPESAARLRSRASGSTPGAKCDARAAAPAMLTTPTARNTINPNSAAPSPQSIAFVLNAIAATGTDNCPSPASPSTWIRTCHDPVTISHSAPWKNCGSSLLRCATSAVGGCFAASPVNGSGVIRTSRIPGEAARISTSATPGIAAGGRTVTNRR